MPDFNLENAMADAAEKIFKHKNTESFISSLIDNGVHDLEYEDLNLQVLAQGMEYLDDNEFLLISFSGAVRRGKEKVLPKFSFLGVTKTLSLPLISFSDPSLSLHPDLRLSWYAGNKNTPDLLNRLATLCDLISLKTKKKIILAGGSGGGFAVLHIQNLMLQHEQTISLVWNPQTDLTKYLIAEVRNYVNYAFLKKKDYLLERENIHNFLKEKINYKILRKKDRACVVLMDGYDHPHLRNHLRSWLGEELPSKKIGNSFFYEKMLVHLGDWGVKGHTPPPRELVIQTVKDITSKTNFNDFYIVKHTSNFEPKKCLILTDDLKETLEREVVPRLGVIGSLLSVKINLNQSYIGYQLIISLKNLKTKKIIGTSGYLRCLDQCEAFFKIRSSSSMPMINLKNYALVLCIEDYQGNELIIEKRVRDCVVHKFSTHSMIE